MAGRTRPTFTQTRELAAVPRRTAGASDARARVRGALKVGWAAESNGEVQRPALVVVCVATTVPQLSHFRAYSGCCSADRDIAYHTKYTPSQMVDDGRYRLLSRPRFIGSARINRHGWGSQRHFTSARSRQPPDSPRHRPSLGTRRDWIQVDVCSCT